MITVVAALIEQDGRLLICQRRRSDRFPLKWEFPGGKVKSGESPAEALRRELEEELGVTTTIGRELYRTRHHYAEMNDEIELLFFAASLSAGNDEAQVHNLVFESVQWAEPCTLAQYDFLPADRELVSLLATGAVRCGLQNRRPEGGATSP